MNDIVIGLFKSKTVWVLLVGLTNWIGEKYLGWSWFTNLDPAIQTLIVGVYGALVLWCRNMAARNGTIVSLTKTIGMKK